MIIPRRTSSHLYADNLHELTSYYDVLLMYKLFEDKIDITQLPSRTLNDGQEDTFLFFLRVLFPNVVLREIDSYVHIKLQYAPLKAVTALMEPLRYNEFVKFIYGISQSCSEYEEVFTSITGDHMTITFDLYGVLLYHRILKFLMDFMDLVDKEMNKHRNQLLRRFENYIVYKKGLEHAKSSGETNNL